MTRNGVSLKDVYDIVNRFDEKLDKLETRVGSLEGFRGQIVIVVSVVMTTITLFGDQIKKKIGI